MLFGRASAAPRNLTFSEALVQAYGTSASASTSCFFPAPLNRDPRLMKHQQDGRPEILGHIRSSTSFFIRLNSLCLYINLLIYRRPLLTLFPEDFYFCPANSEIWSRLSPLQICLLSLQSRLRELGQTQRMQAAGHRRQAQPSWNRPPSDRFPWCTIVVLGLSFRYKSRRPFSLGHQSLRSLQARERRRIRSPSRLRSTLPPGVCGAPSKPPSGAGRFAAASTSRASLMLPPSPRRHLASPALPRHRPIAGAQLPTTNRAATSLRCLKSCCLGTNGRG